MEYSGCIDLRQNANGTGGPSAFQLTGVFKSDLNGIGSTRGRNNQLPERCVQKSAKRFVELRGFRPDIDADGWPGDRKHPVYRER